MMQQGIGTHDTDIRLVKVFYYATPINVLLQPPLI